MTPDELEDQLGDPRDPGNPLGFAAIVAADERALDFVAGQRALAGFDLLTDGLVPVSGVIDGVAGRVEALELLRTVYRRDPRLGTRITAPGDQLARLGAAVGALDTGLRTTLRHAGTRRLYGRTVLDLPYIRASLATVFVDLLICDAVATCPVPPPLVAEVVQVLARRLTLAMRELSVILGARFYVREGEHAIFGKLLRDVEVICRSAGPITGSSQPAAGTAITVAACLSVWRASQDPFLSEPTWLHAALARIEAGPRWRPTGPVAGWLVGELLTRHAELRSFGLTRRCLPG